MTSFSGTPTGQGRCIYDELFDLARLGPLSIRRASHVEPEEGCRWIADLSPVDGPQLVRLRIAARP